MVMMEHVKLGSAQGYSKNLWLALSEAGYASGDGPADKDDGIA
jgi:hypothetical protein